MNDLYGQGDPPPQHGPQPGPHHGRPQSGAHPGSAPYHGQPQQQPPARPSTSGARVGLGLGLLAVPVVALALAYVLPTLRTLTMSFESGSRLVAGEVESAGTDNFERLFADSSFLEGFLPVTLLAAATVVTGAVIAPLMAWCLHLAGAGTRMAGRIVWGVAAIAFAPTAMTIAWYTDRIISEADRPSSLLHWAGLLSAVVLGTSVLVALASFRGGTDTGRKAKTVLITSGLVALALVAAAWQAFTFTTFTGVPAPPQSTPLVQIYNDGFRTLDTGVGAAKSVVMLTMLALLGLGAALLFIIARVRIDLSDGPGRPRSFRAGAGAGAIVLLVASAAGVVVALWPWLTQFTDTSTDMADPTEVMVRTWLPPLITTGIAIVASLAGGFALGAVRPMGEHSRWLLLLFAPWLFVGSGPLMLAGYEAAWEADLVGTFVGLIPLAWIAVPALFVFTALFWGLEDRRRAMVASGTPASTAAGSFAAGAWPMVALVGMAVWIANTRDVIWQMLMSSPEEPTATTVLLYDFDVRSADGVGIGYPPVLLFGFAAVMIAAAVFYLPRVGIRTGR